jgi:energy-coupling factor transport system ATP-binding protein
VAASVRATGWGWRHSGRRAWGVHDLNLSIEPGERVLLLGASGSGKSTLVAALAGVLGSDEGEQAGDLRVDGLRPHDAFGRTGLVLQDPDSQVVLGRVGDDVAFGCENLGVPRGVIWQRVSEALEDVGLDLPLDRSTSDLSGGQKQRLALAGVLAMRPGLLLLDEPTANLDPAGVAEVRDAVARTLDGSGATLIVIEHRVEVWRDLVDRVIILDATGGLLADGPVDRVLATRGGELAGAGVWVPEYPPVARTRTSSESGGVLGTRDLVVSRVRGSAVAAVPDLSVRAGGLTALTGPNGSGKSTLALTLGGLLRPESGAVIAEPGLAIGLDPAPASWKSRQLVARIGSVFQDPEHQFLAATVWDELAVGPRALRSRPSETKRTVDELLGRLGLDRLALANPFTLSGGEKRRLSVGTALATNAPVLILDEPTFGQDSRTWAEIVDLLSVRLDEGTAIAAVSHDGAFLDALATEVVALGVDDVAGARS